MMARCTPFRLVVAAFGFAVAAALPAAAQQMPGGWQPQPSTPAPGNVPGNVPAWAATPGQAPEPPAAVQMPNTTVVPRSRVEPRAPSGPGGVAPVSLTALLTEDGQSIEQGLVWHVFRDKPGPDGKPRLVSTHRDASPTLRLEAGDYFINVAFGRANLTRKISVTGAGPVQERFVLNAGALRLMAVLGRGSPLNDRAVSYDIFSDERDQYGQRTRIASALKPGVIVRLNAGIYNVVSTYGDANAIARADVTVEAGKLTDATLSHAAATVTFKLVARSGGDAIADTQWSITSQQGEPVKESAGALPTHILAPGTYTDSARRGGQVYQRDFVVHAGEVVQVEVVTR